MVPLRTQRWTLHTDKRVRLARASELLALFVYALEEFALKAGTEMFDGFKRLSEQRLFGSFCPRAMMSAFIPVLLDARLLWSADPLGFSMPMGQKPCACYVMFSVPSAVAAVLETE